MGDAGMTLADTLEVIGGKVGYSLVLVYCGIVYGWALGHIELTLDMVPYIAVLPLVGAALSYPFAKAVGFGGETPEDRIMGEGWLDE